MNLKNPMNSEYLTWYVLKDETAKKGVISVCSEVIDSGLYNFSVDYPKDYDDVVEVISKLEKPFEAQTKEILKFTSGLKKVD